MATAKQRAAARRNIKKAQAALRRDIRRTAPKRRVNRRAVVRTIMPRRRRSTMRRTTRRRTMSRSGIIGKTKSIFRSGITGDIVKGVGGGTIAGIVFDRVAPRFATPANLVGGFVAGGLWGGIVNALLSGGLNALNIAGIQSGGTQNGRSFAL